MYAVCFIVNDTSPDLAVCYSHTMDKTQELSEIVLQSHDGQDSRVI